MRISSGKTLLKRTNVLFGLFLFAALIITSRFAYLQLDNFGLRERALGSLDNYYTGSLLERGEIFLQDRFKETTPLAVNKDFFLIYVEPDRIENAEEAALALGGILNIPYETILRKTIKQGDPYEVIAQRVTDEIADAVNELNMRGIRVQAQKGRFYPYQDSASHVAGFLGIRGDRRIGQYGIEGFYEDELRDEETQIKKGFYISVCFLDISSAERARLDKYVEEELD